MTERLHFHFSLSCIGEGNGNPLQCSCLENPRDGGGWWAAVYGVAQSWTWLKRLSSSSSKIGLLARFCAWEKWGSEKGSKDHTAGLPWWLSGIESTCQCCRHRFDPWCEKIPQAPKQLGRPMSRNYWAQEPQLRKPMSPRAHAPAAKKATTTRTYAPHRRAVPGRSNEDPAQPKIKLKKK